MLRAVSLEWHRSGATKKILVVRDSLYSFITLDQFGQAKAWDGDWELWPNNLPELFKNVLGLKMRLIEPACKHFSESDKPYEI